jgi:uncharacterized protein
MASELRAWQRMLSGRRLDLLDPSPLDIEIEDIAHGLARVARWNGQTFGDHAFSVAQHCVLVEAIAFHVNRQLDKASRLMALLHDAPEYVVGDMISPFKAALGLDYKSFENRLLGAIHMRFSLPPKTPAPCETEIKQADKMAAYLEATQLAGFSVPEAEKFFGRPKGLSGEGSRKFLQLKPLAPNEAAALYLKKFKLLVIS